MEKDVPNIKHIVVSGGGTFGLTAYGTLRELQIKGFWKYDNIQSFYGTSVGTIVILFLLLGYDWETLDNFLIKRPWGNIFNYDIKKCIDLYENCGAFDISVFKKSFDPLFKGVDMEVDITLKELYNKTEKEFYIYVTELNYFTCDCISHKTHPDWKVIDAIYASCCLPMIFQPLIKDDKAYVDGGLFLNYPILKCTETEGIDKDEVLGIYKEFTQNESDKKLSDSSTMIDYFAVLCKNILNFTNSDTISDCKHQICFNHIPTTMETLFEFINSSNYREELINSGKEQAQLFLDI